MADVLEEYFTKHNIKDITIFAIPIVANLGEYSAYRRLKNNFDITPIEMELGGRIEKLGYNTKNLKSEKQYISLYNKLIDAIKKGTNGKNALIALTELSIILSRYTNVKNKIEINLIDGLEIYADKFANIYIDTLPKLN